MSTKSSSASYPSPLAAVGLAALAAFAWPYLLVPSAPWFNPVETVDVDGVPFPRNLVVAGCAWKQHLLGGAPVRDGPRHYSVGIYVEEDPLHWVKKWHPEIKDFVGDTLEANAFCACRQGKTLLLKMDRGVSTQAMAEGFADPIVERIGDERAERLKKFFVEAMGTDRLEAGSEVVVTCHGEHLYVSSDGGRDAKTYLSRGVCPAIFHSYLGSKSVAPEARDAAQKGFEDLEFYFSFFSMHKRKAMLVR